MIMLFGSENIQDNLIKIAKEYEKEKNIKIIYGAMVGVFQREFSI